MNQSFTLKKGLMTIMSLLLFVVVQAQTKKISGKVTADDDHSSLPGVSVTIKGTTQGGPTSADGTYTIQASPNDVLVFRFMGYGTQEITVGQQTMINIALKPDNKALNEVVVVGYGTQSRKSVTSAIATLDNKVLATAPRANIGSALQGTVSGLQVVNSSGAPGATPLIVLRGGASINSPGAPLVVVDGVIRAYNDIPADDIASIDLLKDAASTAIYGARANNGVILI
ncbi:carboxypeptidase-like regulatory domain-containing protein, partial [Mucilaginibacter sp.]|uniref:carboxypeptidase-like regulatory domain-containing protein n=1 Tax=Mucilaginibacter sp. TaxID=1882438 RepID=UPI002ED12898